MSKHTKPSGLLCWERHRLPGGAARKNHTATLVGNKVYIFAGYETAKGTNHADILVLEAKKSGFVEYKLEMPTPNWHHSSPLPRNGHTANLVQDKLFAFGGWGGRSVFTDVCIFDFVLRQWWIPETRGVKHPMLNMHVSEYIEWMNAIICFGGGDGQVFESGPFYLNVETLKWKRLEAKGTSPAKRANCSSCVVDTTLFIYGGWNRTNRFDDLHLLNLPMNGTKPFWTEPKLDPRPPARVGAGLIGFYGNVLMYGGMYQVLLHDVQVFDVKRQAWRTVCQVDEAKGASDDFVVQVTGPFPKGRVGHTVTALPGGSILVYGGSGSHGSLQGYVHTLRRL